MAPLVLPPLMSPAQEQGWQVLLDLAETCPVAWCIVGGQMTWLLAAEYGVEPRRATEDVDVVVDVRAEPAGIQRLCLWLEDRHIDLEGISAQGVGHRYSRAANPGPGRIIFDVLAPENVGRRAVLSTTRGAHTLEAPGTRIALNNAERLEVSLGDRTGWVYRPKLLAAIITKTVATTIPGRSNVERDFYDAALLLSLIPDPISAAQELNNREKAQLRAISSLLNDQHEAWLSLGPERARLGHSVLEFLLT